MLLYRGRLAAERRKATPLQQLWVGEVALHLLSRCLYVTQCKRHSYLVVLFFLKKRE
jgi:hypothetical protein